MLLMKIEIKSIIHARKSSQLMPDDLSCSGCNALMVGFFSDVCMRSLFPVKTNAIK